MEQKRSRSLTAHPTDDRNRAEAHRFITEMKGDRIEALRALAMSGKQGPKSDAIRELCDALQACQRRREKAIGPSLPEVMAYAEQIGMNSGEPERFYDYHCARGWKMGKTASAPMRDWRAALRLWNRNCVPVVGKKPAYGVG